MPLERVRYYRGGKIVHIKNTILVIIVLISGAIQKSDRIAQKGYVHIYGNSNINDAPYGKIEGGQMQEVGIEIIQQSTQKGKSKRTARKTEILNIQGVDGYELHTHGKVIKYRYGLVIVLNEDFMRKYSLAECPKGVKCTEVEINYKGHILQMTFKEFLQRMGIKEMK